MAKALKKVTRKLLKSNFATTIISKLISAYIRLVRVTTKWQINGLDEMNAVWDEHKSVIIVMWHARTSLIATFWNKKHPLYALISQHKDGQLMGKVLGNFGLGKIEGSSTSNSRAAAIQLLKALKSDKSICFTPDGPTGPAMEMTLSPLVFAQKSGKPVIGMVYSVSRAFISRKSWDDMMIPLPFSRGVLNCTKPFFIPKDASAEELEKHRLEIEKALVEASVDADKAVGREPVYPSHKVKKKKTYPYPTMPVKK